MKNKNYKYIDDLFKEKLETSEDQTNDWEENWLLLEARLKREDKYKQIIFWLKAAGGIAALLLLAFSLWYFYATQPIQTVEQIVTKTEHRPIEDNTPPPVYVAETKSDTHLRESTQFNLVTPDRQRIEIGNVAEVKLTEKIAGGGVPHLLLDPIKQIDASQMSMTLKTSSSVIPDNRSLTSLSVLYAPAINGVSSLDKGKIGTDVGLMVTIGLTPKWSLGTGIIYAKKLYETNFDNYRPNNTVGFRYHPQDVYADCRVLDIPLMVNYQFLNKGKNSFGAGVGMSSYIMLKEDYRFIYAKPNKYDVQDYQLINKNQHWLSMLNLQVTYERQMSSKLSLGLQPYLRIPMHDIGYANVKLQSLGMGVTINWSLNKLPMKP